MEIMRRLQLSTGIGTCGSTCICIGGSVGIDTGSVTCIGTGICAQDVDYCLTIDALVRFRDNIYFPYSSELKKMILRDFHVKPSSSHPG